MKTVTLFLIALVGFPLVFSGCSQLPHAPDSTDWTEMTGQPEGGAPSPPSDARVFWKGGENIYRVGPGDILKITVYGEPDISGHFKISREGTISWSWVGEIEVAGLSAAEIGENLKKILVRDYIRQPRIETEVAEYRSQIVYFFGNVNSPGISRLGEKRSLLTNLLQAGGPRVWGDGTIGILRTDAETGEQRQIMVSLKSLLRGEEDILLKNKDIITVSAPDAKEAFISGNRVYIVGAVNNPGSFPWQDNMTALDALMRGGGLSDYAAGNRSRVVRGQGEKKKEYRVEFEEILEGEKDKNINLLPGDLIIVPESWI